jgi:hypothetical protein
MSHFGLAHALGEALALLFRAWHSSSVLTRSAKRFMADQVDAMIFCVHCKRCCSSSLAECLECSAFRRLVCVDVL